MASGPITSWEIEGEMVETVADFIFLSNNVFETYSYQLELESPRAALSHSHQP